MFPASEPARQSVRADVVAWGVCALLAAVAGSSLPGCAHPDGKTGSAVLSTMEGGGSDAAGALRALAAREVDQPDQGARAVEPPLGLTAADVLPPQAGSPEAVRAAEPLEVALAAYAPADGGAPHAEAAPVDEDQLLSSLKLYVGAREKLMDRQAAQAVTDLERAARLNPGSPQVQRALGEAYAAAGRRSSALAAFERALSLGLDDADLRAALGREAVRAGNAQRAVPLLRDARAEALRSGDAFKHAALGVDLAEALIAEGRLSGARALLTESLDRLPDSAPPSSTQELSEVYRRRGELWQKVGDLSLRLNDAPGAVAAYKRAAGYPSVDPGALLPRRVYASLRSGFAGQAAIILLEDMQRVAGRIDDRHTSSLGLVSRTATAGPLLTDALAEMASNPRFAATPSVLGRLARASAACVAPAQARRILSERLASEPSDLDALAAYLAAFEEHASDRARAVAELTARSPWLADAYADAFIRRGAGVSAALSDLSNRKQNGAATLLHAAMLRRLGRAEEALGLLEAMPRESVNAATQAMGAMCAMTCGRFDRAIDLARAALEQDTQRPARAGAAGMASIQEFAEAYKAMQPDGGATGSNVHDCLVGAELALNAELPDRAEAQLRHAAELDPSDERAYEGLFDLYAPRGLLADETKLNELARSVRDNVPNGKLARGIAARELLSRGLWNQAQTALLGMVDANTESMGTLSLLATAWDNQIRAEGPAGPTAQRALEWVRARMVGREESPTLVILLARLLGSTGKAAEADDVLVRAEATTPASELGKMREYLAREVGRDPAKAAELAVERLEKTARGIDATIELAGACVRLGRFERAAAAIGEGLPTSIRLTGAQRSSIGALAAGIAPDSVTGPNVGENEGVLKLLDAVESRKIELTPAAYLLRVVVLCQSHPGETDRLFNAVAIAAEKTKQRDVDVIVRVAQVLLAADDPSNGLRFIGAAVGKSDPFNADLAFEWLRLTFVKGDGEDMAWLVSSVREPGKLLERIAVEFDDKDAARADNDTDRRCELAYWLGNGASAMGRESSAEEGYRLALRYKPDHGWTLNNLGYLLLEKGGHFEESVRMIEAAFAQLSSEPSVVDSMGWVRYKQGRFTDETDASGRVARGAVSLLREAVDSPVKETNAEQVDHLADALWRSGARDEARQMWARSLQMMQSTLTIRRAGGGQDSEQSKRLAEQVELVQAKARAAEAGNQPAVAPTQAEIEAGAAGRTEKLP